MRAFAPDTRSKWTPPPARAGGQKCGCGPRCACDTESALRSPGQALPANTRAAMEQRFGADFSGVRVHTDEQAATSAQALSAAAYTRGRDIIFAGGRYRPQSAEGQRLLAHELTHVVQAERAAPPSSSSSSLWPSSPDSSAEREADAVAARVGAGAEVGPIAARPSAALQAKLTCDDPATKIPNPTGKGIDQTNAQTLQGYLQTLCPSGGVTVDGKTGEVKIPAAYCTPVKGSSPAQKAKTATGCTCICDMVNSAHQSHVQIRDNVWPNTVFDDQDAADGKKPGGSGSTLQVPSPNTDKLWGAATVSGKYLNVDPALVVFGHELCGHMWLGDQGKQGPDDAVPRGEGGHQDTVARENLLRAEHGIEARGGFKDPDCGESFWRDKSDPTGAPNFGSYHAACVAWRADYNKKHGTKYTITDKIP